MLQHPDSIEKCVDPRSYDYFIKRQAERRGVPQLVLFKDSRYPKTFEEWIPQILEKITAYIPYWNQYQFALSILTKNKEECLESKKLNDICLFHNNSIKVRLDILVGKLFRFDELAHLGYARSEYTHSCNNDVCINPWHLKFTEAIAIDDDIDEFIIDEDPLQKLNVEHEKLQVEHEILNKKLCVTIEKNEKLLRMTSALRLSLYRSRLDFGLLEDTHDNLLADIRRMEDSNLKKDEEYKKLQHRIYESNMMISDQNAEIADLKQKYITASRDAYIKELDALTGIDFFKEASEIYKRCKR